MGEILLPAIYDTLVMVFFSTLFAVILGSILGIILIFDIT